MRTKYKRNKFVEYCCLVTATVRQIVEAMIKIVVVEVIVAVVEDEEL